MKLVYEDADLLVANDFLPDPDLVRERGVRSQFGDYAAPDGQVYKRVAIGEIPEVTRALGALMGRPIKLLGMAYRLNYEGEIPNHEIHADLGWGTYAAVVYLSSPPEGTESGTAFWQHRTGYERVKPGDVAAVLAVQADWNDETQWEQTAFVRSEYNSAIVYRSEMFHSRWPFSAYGSTPEDGRLAVVVFFD